MSRSSFLALLCLASVAGGCATRKPPVAAPKSPPAAPAPVEPIGHSAVELLAAPDPRSADAKYEYERADKVALNASFTPAAIDQTEPLPTYPREALLSRVGLVRVAVRVVLNDKGAVVDVVDSPADRAAPGPFAAAFRAAVDEALRQWRFQPAELRTFEWADADGDGTPETKVTTGWDTKPSYLDLLFTFEIVDADGDGGEPAEGRVRLGD